MVAEPPPSPRFAPGGLDRVFATLERQVERGDLPAAALAIARPAGVVRSEAFGHEAGGRVGVGHRFAVASVTKPIVATAVIQLVEAGRLGLNVPVGEVMPEFGPPPVAAGRPGGEVVTPWHLLTHTSGAADGDWTEGAVTPPAAELLRGVCERPLAFVPGTQYRYASDTFLVLGELVRRAGGWPTLALALRERIFEPLGMTATGFAMEDPDRPSTVAHLLGVPDELARSRAIAFAATEHPGGGLWSTVGDLARFGRAMLLGGTLDGARILSRPWLELMTREQTLGILEAGDPPRRSLYGLGWATSSAGGREPGSVRQFDHMGATGSRLWVDPGHGLVIALAANLWGVDRRFAEAVVAATYGALDD